MSFDQNNNNNRDYFAHSQYVSASENWKPKEIFKEILSNNEPKQLFLFLLCTLVVCALELLNGWWSGSLSLLSAGYHSAFDCLSMTISLFSMAIAKQNRNRGTGKYSYGLERAEVLAGFANTIFLLFVNLFLTFEAIERVFEPTELRIHTDRVLLVAFIGLLVSIIGSIFFSSSRQIYSEQKTAHQENMLSIATLFNIDAVGNIVAIISTWLMSWGWLSADPVFSMLFVMWSVWNVVPILKRTCLVLVQATPATLHDALHKALREASTVEGVLECRDEHFWTLAPMCFVGSLVVKVRNDASEQRVSEEVTKIFEPFLTHLTVQVEKDDWILDH